MNLVDSYLESDNIKKLNSLYHSKNVEVVNINDIDNIEIRRKIIGFAIGKIVEVHGGECVVLWDTEIIHHHINCFLSANQILKFTNVSDDIYYRLVTYHSNEFGAQVFK